MYVVVYSIWIEQVHLTEEYSVKAHMKHKLSLNDKTLGLNCIKYFFVRIPDVINQQKKSSNLRTKLKTHI